MTNTSKVASIIKSFTNTGRIPIVYGMLECGHSCEVKLVKPTRTSWSFPKDREEHDRQTNPHHEHNWLTKVGDELECKYCGFYQAALEKLKALDPATISHSRMRHNQIYVYAYDKTSPTGVSNVLNIDPTDEVEQILRSRFHGATPLSPTEPR